MTMHQVAILFRDEAELGGTVSLPPSAAKAAVQAAKDRKAKLLRRFGDPLDEPKESPPPKRRRRRR